MPHPALRRSPQFSALSLSTLVAVVATSLAALVPAGTAGAAALPSPTRISIDAVGSATSAPPATPGAAIPNVIVEVGETFFVDVSFWDETSEAAFNKDTPLRLTTNVGSLTVTSAVALAGTSTARLTGTFSAAVNNVTLTVDDTATGRKAGDIAGDTADSEQVFDVLFDVIEDDGAGPGYQRGIGGEQNTCVTATRADPVCGVVVLRNGAENSQVLLSTGLCGGPTDAYAPCLKSSGVVVQVLAGLDGLGYGPSSPATLIVKCDKSFCGTGSIQSSSLVYSLGGNDALGPIAACPAKGTLAQAGTPCLDYVQSKRDGSGDSHLYFLFDRDARVSVG